MELFPLTLTLLLLGSTYEVPRDLEKEMTKCGEKISEHQESYIETLERETEILEKAVAREERNSVKRGDIERVAALDVLKEELKAAFPRMSDDLTPKINWRIGAFRKRIAQAQERFITQARKARENLLDEFDDEIKSLTKDEKLEEAAFLMKERKKAEAVYVAHDHMGNPFPRQDGLDIIVGWWAITDWHENLGAKIEFKRDGTWHTPWNGWHGVWKRDRFGHLEIMPKGTNQAPVILLELTRYHLILEVNNGREMGLERAGE